MKKRVLVLAALITLSILTSSVLAEEAKVDKAYSCLSEKVKDKCSGLTLDEQQFSLLALAYDSKIASECKSALMQRSKNNECWPSSGCELKKTALSLIALNRIASSNTAAESWLLKQTKIPDELSWYIQLDTKEESNCKILYDNKNYSIKIDANKRLTGSPGACLSFAQSNYWLQISSSCLNKNFKISCDKDFISALIFKKLNSDTWFVSSQTKFGSSNSVTDTQVNSLCFQQNDKCDYEASLWASIALQKNHNIEQFMPYLITLASDNEKYNPNAFLSILTGADEYLSVMRAKQNPAGFWDLSSGFGKSYDTSLSLLALKDIVSEHADKAREWLLAIQGTDGCFGSIKDTAFILYAGWPKTPAKIADVNYCEDAGKFCSSRTECVDEAKGEILTDYLCRENSLKSCCSKQIPQKTCVEKNGIKCASDEACDGDSVSASDSDNCCIGTCVKEVKPECEIQGFLCKNQCSETEEIKPASCPGIQYCCGAKTKGGYWWIWFLIILIILAVLAIIFRKRIQVWYFQMKSRFRKGPPVTPTRPPFTPPPGLRRILPQARLARPVSKIDKEFEETMKKLRKMSE